MAATWIVSANSSRARIFSQSHPTDKPEEVFDLENEKIRLPAADRTHDRLGPTAATKSKHGAGASAPNKTYEPHMSPNEKEEVKFARDISKFLLKSYQEHRFQHLVLAASPDFLGELRAYLDPHLEPLVTQEINKDFTMDGPDQLREHLAHSRKR